jgi:hypothetical protein
LEERSGVWLGIWTGTETPADITPAKTHNEQKVPRFSGVSREKVPNEACNQNNGVPTLALVRTLLSVRRAENWKPPSATLN